MKEPSEKIKAILTSVADALEVQFRVRERFGSPVVDAAVDTRLVHIKETSLPVRLKVLDSIVTEDRVLLVIHVAGDLHFLVHATMGDLILRVIDAKRLPDLGAYCLENEDIEDIEEAEAYFKPYRVKTYIRPRKGLLWKEERAA